MSPNQSDVQNATVNMLAQVECPYCRNIYDRNKLVFNSIISQYICLDCRQMLMDRSEQRRIIRERDTLRQDTLRHVTMRQETQMQETQMQETLREDTDENV